MDNQIGPFISKAESEKEQELIQQLANSYDERIELVGINSIELFLSEVGLTIDGNGFIIDKLDNEYVRPVKFNTQLFRENTKVSDNPLTEYFSPRNEQRVHISNLYTVNVIDGVSHPVKDEWKTIKQFHESTGLSFPVITMWSENIRQLPKNQKTIIFRNHPESNPVRISCHCCDYTSLSNKWNIEEQRMSERIYCPECGKRWSTRK